MASGLRLQQGETVVLDVIPSAFWTMGKYVLSLGLWTFWRPRHHFVVTNQRVLVFRNGLLTQGEKTVPLSRIQDVALRRSILSGGHVVLSGAGGILSIQSIGPLTREQAREFADAIGERIHQGSQGLSVPHAAAG